MGCTDCGRKGGCDHRKQGMFDAIDLTLARLYPTRRWGERDDGAVLDEASGGAGEGGGGGAPAAEERDAVAAALAVKLKTEALVRPGDPDEWCDYVYVLCMGRTPSIIEVREGLAPAGELIEEDGGGEDGVEERYLRVCLSAVARVAGVQEVAMNLRRDGDDLIITERARTGVFDPVLLPRFQSLVAVLAQLDIRHIDFGEIMTPPEGFDPADYPARYGGAQPVIANYLFSPQPPAAATTVILQSPRLSARPREEAGRRPA